MLSDHVEDDFLVVFLADVTGKGAAVLGHDRDHLVGIGDVVAGVKNVEEKIIEIGSIGASEFGADLTAFAIHHVAGGADGLIEFTAFGGIGFGEGFRGGERFVFRNFGFFVRREFLNAEFFGEFGSKQKGERAGDIGRESLAGNFVFL